MQNYVREKLLKAFPHLKKKDISVALEGQQGPDIILSRIGKKLVGPIMNTWHTIRKTNLGGRRTEPLVPFGKMLNTLWGHSTLLLN